MKEELEPCRDSKLLGRSYEVEVNSWNLKRRPGVPPTNRTLPAF